jgi:hypothetical protein
MNFNPLWKSKTLKVMNRVTFAALEMLALELTVSVKADSIGS